MSQYTIEIDLLSDTTFALGLGVSGVVDTEIRQDALGFPTLSGRAIKGLLANECAEILNMLPKSEEHDWAAAARRLFGERGELEDVSGRLRIREATCAPDLRAAVDARHIPPGELKEAMTAIRRQTKVSENGAPDDESLRAVRVVIRGLTLYAPIQFYGQPNLEDKALLAACALSLRRAGLGRNRGKGKVITRITNRPLNPDEFAVTELLSQDNLALGWLEPLREVLR